MRVKTTVADIVLEIISIVLSFGSTVYLCVTWKSLPEKIPVHYNFAGEIDRWGGKGDILFLVVILWFLFILMTVVERFPRIWNTGVTLTEENVCRIYRILKYMLKTIKLITVLIFAFLILNTTAQTPLPVWFLPVCVVLVIGDMVFWLIVLYRNR